MKKLLLLATATTLLSTGAYAADVTTDSDDLKLQLLGRFNFQGGYTKQSKIPGLSQNISTNRKNFAFYTNAFTAAKITAEHEDLKYGAQLALATATRGTATPVYDRSHIFMESNWGKIELGSSFSSSAKMAITAFDIARATGDDGTNYILSYIEEVPSGTNIGTASTKDPLSISAPSTPGFFLDSNNFDQNNGESSRKVTYYTPEMGGFQLGVSFIPDSGNLGNGPLKSSDKYNTATTYVTSVTDPVTQITTQTTYSEQKPVKDAYTIALAYKHDISENVNFKVSVAGEYGQPANPGTISVQTTTPAPAGAPAGTAPTVTTTPTTTYKLAKLNTYNVGGVLTLGNYSLAASYGDWGKSMTSSQVLGNQRSTKFYTVGGSYAQGPVGASFVYSKSKQYGGSMDLYVLGTDYKLAPGLLPYAEVAYFNGKANLAAVYKSTAAKKNFKGWVFVFGAKLAF